MQDVMEYNAAIKRDYPHNYKVFVLFDLIWGLGMPFACTLVPAFLVVLGASKSLIGFVASLPLLGAVFQIVISYYFRHLPKKRWLSFSYFAAAIPWFVFNIYFFLNWGNGSNTLKLGLFCLTQAVMWFISSGNEGIRFAMLSECAPVTRRGFLFGSRVAVQVVMSLAVWPVAIWVLGHWPQPRNILISFTIATFFYMLCPFSYLLTREHHDPRIDNGDTARGWRPLLADSISRIKLYVSDGSYRTFLLIWMIQNCAVTMVAFIVVYAKDQMQLSDAKIIHFTILQMLGGAVTTTLLGRLADRIGYKQVGIIVMLPLTAGFLLAGLIAHQSDGSLWMVYLSFILCAGMVPVSRMIGKNMAIELMSSQNIGMLLSLSTVLTAPFVLVVVPLGGWMVDVTGSYVLLFLAGALLTIISGLGFVFFIREPRVGQ